MREGNIKEKSLNKCYKQKGSHFSKEVSIALEWEKQSKHAENGTLQQSRVIILMWAFFIIKNLLLDVSFFNMFLYIRFSQRNSQFQ